MNAAARSIVVACGLAALTAVACRPRTASPPAAAPARVVLVCVDGLMPEAYTAPDAHGLAVPTLRRLAAAGAFAARVAPVFPSVTYPAHTTLVTGAPPGVHGITTNSAPDPLDANHGGWRWYAEDIAVPTLWDAVEAGGRPVGLVTWPVTVGARVRYRVPEYWRAGTADDLKLLRALSTPGLLEEIAGRRPSLWRELGSEDRRDDAQLAIARHLALEAGAELVLVHVWQTDGAQHAQGPWSPAAVAAIEHVDALLGELVAALERDPAWPRTIVVVASDHGFAPVAREIRIDALLQAHGLIDLDDDGDVTSARVAAVTAGGTALLYGDDPAAVAEARAALAELGDLVVRVYTPDQIAALGGDRSAALAVVAAPGVGFSGARQPPVVVDARIRGTHGWPPDDPAMAASFIAYGPRVPHLALGDVKMIDIAPTLAAWLGVSLPGATGTAIPELAP